MTRMGLCGPPVSMRGVVRRAPRSTDGLAHRPCGHYYARLQQWDHGPASARAMEWTEKTV